MRRFLVDKLLRRRNPANASTSVELEIPADLMKGGLGMTCSVDALLSSEKCRNRGEEAVRSPVINRRSHIASAFSEAFRPRSKSDASKERGKKPGLIYSMKQSLQHFPLIFGPLSHQISLSD
ncbi:unnamed protein product [Notodromas monacha]|uniref:Uncharacterized protein n=1 Tax=Notodromas monacha TaxID=399045 RepID=A0A7R9BP71_9CRUS|nr:unnamed protein product [Notodromas monacha]CAG0918256.1 unnamed protein product [Notodromas monacha]